MALVIVSQLIILEGYTELKEKKHWLRDSDYVRSKIKKYVWLEAMCDDKEAETIIKEEIEKAMKETKGWGRNFEGWISYRTYSEPGEFLDEPLGKQYELRLDYIRDWKMEKVIKELNAKQFAILCKELGLTAQEALTKD